MVVLKILLYRHGYKQDTAIGFRQYYFVDIENIRRFSRVEQGL